MNRSNKIQVFIITAAVLAVLFVSCVLILTKSTEQHFVRTSAILSSQVKTLINGNEDEKNRLEESLKGEYISRAKALAYILESNPGLESDYDELCRVAELLSIDEIDIFSPKGIITHSTVPEYVGYSMHSGGQISFFLPMLENHSLSLCQDMVPNSKEGKLVMYAMTWRSDGDSLVEVGITPQRLLIAMKDKDISKVLNKLPVNDSLYFIYDAEQDKVVSSTDDSLLGLSGEEASFDLSASSGVSHKAEWNGAKYLYTLADYNNYKIVVGEEQSHLYREVKINSLVLLLFLALVLSGIYVLINIMTSRERKKEEQYVGELKDYADQLSSYKRAILSDALISLEVNLSRNNLYYGVWKDDEGKVVPLNEIIGLHTPCSYDEYIKIWNQRFVKHNDTGTFTGSTDREHLLDTFRRGLTEITFDYEATTISGRATWLRRSICMTRNQSGDVIAYTSVKDISALVAQSKREEAYVRALAMDFDSIVVVGLETHKEDDQVVMFSHMTDDFVSLVDDELLNEPHFTKKLDLLAGYVHPEDVAGFLAQTRREVILDSFRENRTHVVNFRMLDHDGVPVYYEARFFPLKDDEGSLTDLIATLRNADEEKRKDLEIRQALENARVAAEKANEAKSTFLFNMSHDIRTPMNAIIGFTDIAEKHMDDTERVSESLRKVKTASEHLLSLINDVLDMSRVESGQVKLEEESVCIDAMWDNLYSILAGAAEDKNLHLSAAMDSSVVHHWIYADRLRLMRILTNIVSNSVKYTNPGGKIRVLTEELPCDREGYARYRYTVSDTGIGMTPEFLAKIFEPFSRAETATKSGVTGTGLGMAITKSFVELMGGTIHIESELGVGTTVRIEMDNRISEAVDPTGQVDTADFVNLEGKKILLVEDNELNREIATEILEEEGMMIDVAEDGDIAVEKMKNAEKGQYDLILMDIQMPRMNGYDATRAIRALPDPYASGIPILAMTANAFEEDKRNAIAAGMNAHIAKPIDVPKLLGTLSEVLNKRAE